MKFNPTTFRPNHGFILVKLPKVIDTIKMSTGLELAIDISYEPERYQSVYGEIMALPDKLLPDPKTKITPPLHLSIGDVVYFHYLTVMNAQDWHNSGGYWEEDGERFALIEYTSLFFSIWYLTIEGKKDDRKQYQMLNNYILVEPVLKNQHIEFIPGYGNVIINDEPKASSIIILSEEKHEPTEGIVCHAPTGCGVKDGDHVIFENDSDVPLENDLIQTLDRKFFRMKVSEVLCKSVNDTMIPIKNRIVILPDPAPPRTSKIILLNENKPKLSTGTVKIIGDEATEVQVGDRVIYAKDNTSRDILVAVTGHDTLPDNDYRHEIIPEDLVFCKLSHV